MLSLCEYPELLEKKEAKQLFPEDVIERAKIFMKKTSGAGAGTLLSFLGSPLVSDDCVRSVYAQCWYSLHP